MLILFNGGTKMNLILHGACKTLKWWAFRLPTLISHLDYCNFREGEVIEVCKIICSFPLLLLNYTI
jgi:hypothetical protein